MTLFAAPLLLLALFQTPTGPDQDRDGLSDFEEIHKYLTDPARADTDGDGIQDGDWDERREHTYSVRAVIQVLPPINVAALSDDWQDGRVLRANAERAVIEVVCYPLCTAGETIGEDPQWREHAEAMQPWLDPGPTTNWNATMRDAMRTEMLGAGIDDRKLSDRALVQQLSTWLLQRSKGEDAFTTFDYEFVDGKPRIAPGLEEVVARELARSGRTLEEAWQHELFGRGMFETRTHGSCTSTSIYIATCMRAAGIPARTVLCIPVIDASDAAEVAMAKQELTHHRVRRIVLAAARRAGSSWTSHTFNEVWVDGRWRRLNYDRLGQGILDKDFLGLMVHVNTFRDLAEAGLAAWGVRAAKSTHDDVFGGSNPYSCSDLSDRFGTHATIENPALPDHKVLTITRAYWYEDADRPQVVRFTTVPAGGNLLVRVDEHFAGEGLDQYMDFWNEVDKEFVLHAEGRPDVRASGERGYWYRPDEDVRDFYVHVAPEELAKMERGVDYAIVPPPERNGRTWRVEPGLVVRRP